jgi:hypothetical protein
MGSRLPPEPDPEPPLDLAARALPLAALLDPPFWYRLHSIDRAPLQFNPTSRGRFNATNGEFGMLYLAADPFGAFVETFGQVLSLNIPEMSLRDRLLSRVAPTRPLDLVDLTGGGLARIGADARLTSGDHALAQRWSRALWHHPARVDGLLYRARHDPDRFCAALFADRTTDALRATTQGSLLDDPMLLGAILDHDGFALV